MRRTLVRLWGLATGYPRLHPAGMAESPFQPERFAPTPADQFETYIREVEAREAAQPRRPTRPRSTWPQRAIALAVGLALWVVILAGLSRQVFGWP